MADKKKVIFWLEPEMDEVWTAFCKERGMNRTALIKSAVFEYIKRMKGNNGSSDALIKQLADVQATKSTVNDELASVVQQLTEKVSRIDDLMTKMAENANPSEDDRAKVDTLISRGAFTLKEISNLLEMPIERASAVLTNFKEHGLAHQIEEMRWEGIKHDE